MVDVCRLQETEQGMPKGFFPSFTQRPGHGPDYRVLSPVFCSCLLELSLDSYCHRGPAHHHIHHSLQMLLLRKDAVWVKECGCHQPAVHSILF
jgi:hypothetical protein